MLLFVFENIFLEVKVLALSELDNTIHTNESGNMK